MLQWQEAVFHGSCCQRRTSRNKSLHQFFWSKKQKGGHCGGRANERKCKWRRIRQLKSIKKKRAGMLATILYSVLKNKSRNFLKYLKKIAKKRVLYSRRQKWGLSRFRTMKWPPNLNLSNIALKTRFPFIHASTSLDTKSLTIASNRNCESCMSIHFLAPQPIFRWFHFCRAFFLCL